MKYFDWDEDKNTTLKSQRGIGFEDVLIAIDDGNVLDKLDHPKRKNQRILVIQYDNYAYLVPFVEDDEKIFLKTIIPSRKATRDYLKGGKP